MKYKSYIIKLIKLVIRLSLSTSGNLIFYIYFKDKGLAIYSLSDSKLFDIELVL